MCVVLKYLKRPIVIPLLMLGLFFHFPFFSFAQDIKIIIHNRTGYDLDSLSLGRHHLGRLLKDSSVCYNAFRELHLHAGVPLLRPYGLISGKLPPSRTTPCGTKSRKAKPGLYEFDIMFFEDRNGYRLYWQPHRPD